MSEDINDCLAFESRVLLDSNVTVENGMSVTVLSKRAAKRLLKKEKWLKYKPIKRAKEKARLKQKKEAARLKNIQPELSRKALKHNKMSSSSCKLRVVLDFSFDHLMNDKDLNKCASQFNYCYSINRRCSNPLQLYATNFKGKSKEVLSKRNGYENWDINILSEDYLNTFKKEELIYLTSDSENVISSLNESKVYIIGALVDHNSKKGLTLKIAEEQGIGHGRLPIDEFIMMKTRQVLSICHVFEILVNVASSGLSWKDAFLKCIPQRKNIAPKTESEPENTSINQLNNKDIT